MIDYKGLISLTDEFVKAQRGTDCLSISADYLFGNLPGVTVVRYIHVFRRSANVYTLTEDATYKTTETDYPDIDTAGAGGCLIVTKEDIYVEDISERPGPWPDLLFLHERRGAVCFYGVPLFSKGKQVGGLIVGSTPAGALRAPWIKETLDIMGCMVAPYFHLKDVQRDLQLAQTLLHEAMPDKVALGMVEQRTGVGWIPIKHANSDDEDSEAETTITVPENAALPGSGLSSSSDSDKGGMSVETFPSFRRSRQSSSRMGHGDAGPSHEHRAASALSRKALRKGPAVTRGPGMAPPSVTQGRRRDVIAAEVDAIRALLPAANARARAARRATVGAEALTSSRARRTAPSYEIGTVTNRGGPPLGDEMLGFEDAGSVSPSRVGEIEADVLPEINTSRRVGVPPRPRAPLAASDQPPTMEGRSSTWAGPPPRAAPAPPPAGQRPIGIDLSTFDGPPETWAGPLPLHVGSSTAPAFPPPRGMVRPGLNSGAEQQVRPREARLTAAVRRDANEMGGGIVRPIAWRLEPDADVPQPRSASSDWEAEGSDWMGG